MTWQPHLLWDVPAFLEYVQPALTPDAVRAAEKQLRVTLPGAYLAMVEVQNGGHLRATWPDLPHQRLDGIGPRFPSITRDEAWWRTPDAENDMWVPDQPELLIAFDGGGHWNLCFDYRGGGRRDRRDRADRTAPAAASVLPAHRHVYARWPGGDAGCAGGDGPAAGLTRRRLLKETWCATVSRPIR